MVVKFQHAAFYNGPGIGILCYQVPQQTRSELPSYLPNLIQGTVAFYDSYCMKFVGLYQWENLIHFLL